MLQAVFEPVENLSSGFVIYKNNQIKIKQTQDLWF